MKKQYPDQLKELREKIPVGIIHARELLAATKGNIDEAIAMFRTDAVSIVRLETRSSEEMAQQCLAAFNYDIAVAIKHIRDSSQSEEPVAKDKIPQRIMDLLLRSRWGRNLWSVGAKVKPTGNDPSNQAWISIRAKFIADCRWDIARYEFLHFEAEYVEMCGTFTESLHMDYDYYLVKKETYYNIGNETELENVLRTWLQDFSILTDIRSANHPIY